MSSFKEPKQGNRKNIVIIIVFAILVIALAVCIILLVKRPDVEQSDHPEPESTISPAAAALERGFVEESVTQDIMSEMADKVEEGMFECKMTTTWTFEDTDSVSPNAYVANVESNRYTLYFDVYQEGTEELLYSSPMLPVGTEFQEVKLEKDLPAGEYKAVVMYTMVDDNYEEVSSVGFSITISVLH